MSLWFRLMPERWVLGQEVQKGEEQSILYSSRKLLPHEKRYIDQRPCTFAVDVEK